MPDDSKLVRYPLGNEGLDIHKNQYQVTLFCSNCSHIDWARLPKGTPKKGIKFQCEKCGCEDEI